MAITPDGGTLLVGESRGSRYSAFDLATDGTLSRRRVWADLADGAVPGQSRVSPDGCTLDAEGYLWVADAVNRRVVRLTQGGRIVETIDAPDGFGAYACMLGGDGGRTLLLAFAPTHTADADQSAAVLMVTEVDVPHVGLP
jgi:sugar lactone lactonase YvrE